VGTKSTSQSNEKKSAARASSKSGSRPPVSFSGNRGSRPDLKWERKFGFPSVRLVGVDEVGRGCLAGPVVAGAVLLPSVVDYRTHPWLREVSDSKCLNAETRERLVPEIEAWAGAYGIGVATVEEIDRINIFHASHLAMVRAIQAALNSAPGAASGAPGGVTHLLVDGKFLPKSLPHPATAVIKGDLRCLSIAASSVLAKVWRDRLMIELDDRYPGYGLGIHKGYSTPMHAEALKRLGACEIHRRSFAPVAEALRVAAAVSAAAAGASAASGARHGSDPEQTAFWFEDGAPG
jgi:ribonuclease HII